MSWLHCPTCLKTTYHLKSTAECQTCLNKELRGPKKLARQIEKQRKADERRQQKEQEKARARQERAARLIETHRLKKERASVVIPYPEVQLRQLKEARRRDKTPLRRCVDCGLEKRQSRFFRTFNKVEEVCGECAFRGVPKELVRCVFRMWRAMTYRATKFGFEWNILPRDIVIPRVCPVLGIEINASIADRVNSPSLDRFDNSKGYIKENVRVISNRANTLKRDASADELLAIAEYMSGRPRFA